MESLNVTMRCADLRVARLHAPWPSRRQLGFIGRSLFAQACESSACHLTGTIFGPGELTCPLGTCRFQLPRRNLWDHPSTNAPHGSVPAAFLFAKSVIHVVPFATTAWSFLGTRGISTIELDGRRPHQVTSRRWRL